MNRLIANRQANSQQKEVKLPGYHALPGFPPGGETTPISLEASVVLLCSASQRLWKASAVHVESLAGALDHIPLALYAASRFLDERWFWSFERYLKALDQVAEKPPITSADFLEGGLHPKDRRLMAVLLLNYRLLEGSSKISTLARSIYLSAGYCTPNRPIPLELLRSIPTPGMLSETFENALNRLYDLGLFRWTESGPVILEASGDLARRLDSENKAGLHLLAEAGLKICSEEISQPVRGALLAIIAPHLEKTAHHAERDETTFSARIWNQLGHAFWAHFELQRALRCFEKCLRLDESIYGSLHEEVAADCSTLGRILHEIGEFTAAQDFYLRSIAIVEKVFSREYPGIAEDAVRLGRLLYETNDLQGARAMYERALAIHEKSYEYGPRHPSTGSDLHLLGLVLYDLGLLDEARKTFERALSVHEWVYGPHHHTVHADLTQLGRTLRAAGELNEAKKCFERVIQVERKISEQENYNDPSTLNNLGLILQDMGNLKEARKYFERALRIDEETLGPDHPNVARDANNLGCVLRDMGDLPAARVYFRRAITINESARGPEHRDIAVNANNLGRVLYALEDLNGARECFERVLAIDEKIHGQDHLEVANDCANMGTVLHELGELNSARDYFKRALAIYEKSPPSDQTKITNVQKSLDRLKRQIRG